MMDGRLKTLHPKVHGGILCRRDNAGGHAGARRTRHPALRIGRRQPLPLRGDRGQGGGHGTRSDRADRHRRPDADPRRARRTSPSSPSPPAPISMRTILEQVAAQQAHDARAAPQAGRRGLRPHRPLRPRRSPPTSPASIAEGPSRARFPWAWSARRCSATARTRTSRPPSTLATGPGHGQPRRRPATPRQGAFLQQPARPGQRPRRSCATSATRPPSVIKHNNPCGAAEADTLAEALRKALAGDPLSAFGSVLGLNREVDAATAEVLCRAGSVCRGDRGPRLRARGHRDAHHEAQVEGQRPPDDRSASSSGPQDRWAYRFIEGGGPGPGSRHPGRPGRPNGKSSPSRAREPNSSWPTCGSPGRSCGT